MCWLDRVRPAVAGSSSNSCTASTCACHAPTGSSSTEGTAGSRTVEPLARNAGNHSTRWRTTSRATHPLTGAGASHERVPRTRAVNARPISRCRSAGCSDVVIGSDTAPGEQLVELGVALVDADLHAAGQEHVARLETVHKGLGTQAGTPVTEVLEPQRTQRHAVGLPLVRERLH